MPSEHDDLLRETVARHFPDSRASGDEIELGFGDLRMVCWVNDTREIGDYRSASLYFTMRGGRLGDSPVFASASGYGKSLEEAVVTGACNWACAFGPVLRAGLAGEDVPNVSRFEVVHLGQRFDVFVDGLDRAASLDGEDADARPTAARERFAPGSWLALSLLESGRLPLLHPSRPTVLSVFVGDQHDNRVVEVKVDGRDWPGMDEVFAHVAPEPPGAIALLRELAVVVPAGPPPPLERSPLARTLRGLGDARTAREATSWRGWAHHRGELDDPLDDQALARLEASVGALPPDYRAFLGAVAATGAGPGYGLLSPESEAQAMHARGSFAWEDGHEPPGSPEGVLALAHAGCGIMWLLVIAGRHRGEVWVDAASSDGKARRVAGSFTDWYREWLSAAVRDATPWLQWDPRCCATAQVLAQLVESLMADGIREDGIAREVAARLRPGAISLSSGGSAYFARGAPLDPCDGCTTLAAQYGLGDDVFSTPEAPPPRRNGWWSRLTSRLRTRRRPPRSRRG